MGGNLILAKNMPHLADGTVPPRAIVEIAERVHALHPALGEQPQYLEASVDDFDRVIIRNGVHWITDVIDTNGAKEVELSRQDICFTRDEKRIRVENGQLFYPTSRYVQTVYSVEKQKYREFIAALPPAVSESLLANGDEWEYAFRDTQFVRSEEMLANPSDCVFLKKNPEYETWRKAEEHRKDHIRLETNDVLRREGYNDWAR